MELEEGEDEVVVAQQLKAKLESLFWPLAMYDFQTYLNRVSMGTQQFMQAVAQQGGQGGN